MRWKTEPFSQFREHWIFCILPLSFGGITYWLEWIYVYEKLFCGYADSYWEIYQVRTKD